MEVKASPLSVPRHGKGELLSAAWIPSVIGAGREDMAIGIEEDVVDLGEAGSRDGVCKTDPIGAERGVEGPVGVEAEKSLGTEQGHDATPIGGRG